MRDIENKRNQRLNKQAGIAIGPILFIVAILGVLAAAISAGGSGFQGNATADSAKTNAGAIMDIGQNLKTATSRILISNPSATIASIIYTTTDTSTTGLFSPNGGTLTAPSTALGITPGTTQWHYHLYTALTGFGTGASGTQLLAALQVSQSVCQQIQNIITGTTAATIPSGDMGSFVQAAQATGTLTADATAYTWPNSYTTGCLKSTNTNTNGLYYFYSFLANS